MSFRSVPAARPTTWPGPCSRSSASTACNARGDGWYVPPPPHRARPRVRPKPVSTDHAQCRAREALRIGPHLVQQGCTPARPCRVPTQISPMGRSLGFVAHRASRTPCLGDRTSETRSARPATRTPSPWSRTDRRAIGTHCRTVWAWSSLTRRAAGHFAPHRVGPRPAASRAPGPAGSGAALHRRRRRRRAVVRLRPGQRLRDRSTIGARRPPSRASVRW